MDGLRTAVAGVTLAFPALLIGLATVVAAGQPAPPAHAAPPEPMGPPAEVVRRYPAAEARQGVAVDATHFYAITNREIGKYDRATGARVAHWRDDEGGPFIHLNSGRVIGGELYCAHSNYPGVPMVSSIEVFETATLRHLRSIPLGQAAGSATWVDRFDHAWWVAFANYAGRGGEPGRGPAYTTLVRYDEEWRQTGAFVFPDALVARWGAMSTSGGVWRQRDDLLYTAPHDAPELQVLRPRAGGRLELVRTVPIESEGQGIALDPTDDTLIWSIQRRTSEVLVSKLR